MQVPNLCFAALSVLVVCVSLNAQDQVLPGLEGEELLQALAEQYYPDNLMSLSQVKDTLYSKVDVTANDSVRCIYTDFTLFLPIGTDPSQALYQNGSGINLEHSWPQSKGAGKGQDGQRDMHHLFPTRARVNTVRSNHPFGEIEDVETDKWYLRDSELTSIPSTNQSLYSEWVNGRFEPQESSKGNVARAMMYFYTMYTQDANSADPGFFASQLEDFCEWHYADPVDQIEMQRNERIAEYQGNLNPFILDCTLAGRAYCGGEEQCETVSSTEPPKHDFEVMLTQRGCVVDIEIQSEIPGTMVNSIITTGGNTVWKQDTAIRSDEILQIEACHLSSGIYFIYTQFTSKDQARVQTNKVFIP